MENIKKIRNVFITLGVLIVMLNIFLIYRYIQQDNQYNNQKLGVSVYEFQENWGNPDRKIVENDELIFIYNCKGYLRERFVFKFDLKTKKLSNKFYDD